MKEHQSNPGFQYTYSAGEQEEIRRIRQKYTAREETPMERLRRLDRSVTRRAGAWSIVLGVLGVLILGLGMSLFMSDFGGMIGLPGSLTLPVGIGLGLIGGVLVCLAYPVWQYVVRRERKKIAPEILRLTDQLMK